MTVKDVVEVNTLPREFTLALNRTEVKTIFNAVHHYRDRTFKNLDNWTKQEYFDYTREEKEEIKKYVDEFCERIADWAREIIG